MAVKTAQAQRAARVELTVVVCREGGVIKLDNTQLFCSRNSVAALRNGTLTIKKLLTNRITPKTIKTPESLDSERPIGIVIFSNRFRMIAVNGISKFCKSIEGPEIVCLTS